MSDAAPDIKALREGLKWTQEQMAEYLGVDRSSVSRMENGQPLRKSTRRLATALAEGKPMPRPVLSGASA